MEPSAHRRSSSLIARDPLRFGCVLFDVRLPICRHVGIHENRGNRAFWFAKSTINALIRVNDDHVVSFINAVHGTNGHAGLVLDSDAGFCYNVRHSFNEYFTRWSPRISA